MRFIPALAAALLALTGCANQSPTPAASTHAAAPGGAASTATPNGTTRVINTMCPIGGDEFGTHHEPELTRSWNGSAIGFCCKNCVRKFDAMTPAERDAVLALAKANKAP